MVRTVVSRRALALGTLAALSLAAAFGLGAHARESAVESMSQRADEGPWRRMSLPPGEYTSLVLANGGNNSSVVVDFQTPSGTFPLVIGPSQTVQIDFRNGLSVAQSGDYILDATPSRFTLKSEVIRSGFVSVFGTGQGRIIPLVPIR